MTSEYSDTTSTSNFFDGFLFLLTILVTGPRFMWISSLDLESWQFSFIRNWPEIRKSETPPSEFCPISGDWDKLWVPNLARMSLIECYWMLQNSRVAAFTVFDLLRENQLPGGGDWLKLQPPPPCQIRVKTKASRGRIIILLVTCRTIWEPSRISSMSFVVFLILKILHNVFSMKNFWNTNNW